MQAEILNPPTIVDGELSNPFILAIKVENMDEFRNLRARLSTANGRPIPETVSASWAPWDEMECLMHPDHRRSAGYIDRRRNQE